MYKRQELAFPQGEIQEDAFFAPGIFTGVVPLTTLRLPLRDFAGVELTDVRELALLPDATPSGTLFVADVELVAAGE